MSSLSWVHKRCFLLPGPGVWWPHTLDGIRVIWWSQHQTRTTWRITSTPCTIYLSRKPSPLPAHKIGGLLFWPGIACTKWFPQHNYIWRTPFQNTSRRYWHFSYIFWPGHSLAHQHLTHHASSVHQYATSRLVMSSDRFCTNKVWHLLSYGMRCNSNGMARWCTGLKALYRIFCLGEN